MKSDFYNEEEDREFTESVDSFLKEIEEPVKKAIEKYGLSSLNLMIIPLPIKLCTESSISLIKDLLMATMSNRKYLLISGRFQFVDSLFEVLEDKLIENEEYEGIKPLREARKEFQTDEAHYIGHLNF